MNALKDLVVTAMGLITSLITVGLIVDSAREFANVAPDDIKPLPDGIGGTSGRYLRGIAQRGERLLLIVDVRELLETGDQPMDTVPAQAGIFT